jgi:GTP cyclohydrolase I
MSPAKKDKVFYSLPEFQADIKILANQVRDMGYAGLYGIPKGGVPVAMALSDASEIPLVTSVSEGVLVVDDLIDTGRTRSRYPDNDMAVLHRKAWAPVDRQTVFCVHQDCKDWIVYWWEGTEEKSVEDIIIRQLQFIGEDPTREGLLETPGRVIKAWGELFSGYKQDPTKILKSFKEGACDEMVLLKGIEFYSCCEHHLLPFFGKAHIAYIPDGRVVGISKLARLLEVFARRLQIQERLGQQITETLMKELKPKGAACILEAQHFCMVSRGVQKQNSIMVTSSLKGVFLEKPEVRAEFMGLIK